MYFPHAQVVGTDINRMNLLQARRRFESEEIRFVFSADARARVSCSIRCDLRNGGLAV